jgi:hypothetical protein
MPGLMIGSTLVCRHEKRRRQVMNKPVPLLHKWTRACDAKPCVDRDCRADDSEEGGERGSEHVGPSIKEGQRKRICARVRECMPTLPDQRRAWSTYIQ